MAYDFASTQINFPLVESDYYLSKVKDMIPSSDLYEPDDQKGMIQDPHVTVLFGLHNQKPSLELINFIESYPRFVVQLGLVSLFKNETFDVVKVDVNCPDLHVLHSQIKELMPNTQTFPEYIPHSTIAYVKKDTSDHLEGLDTFKGMSFVATHLSFSRKSGDLIYIPFGVRTKL